MKTRKLTLLAFLFTLPVFISGFVSCTNQFETGAIFRGDSPFRFSATSLEMTENESTTMTVYLLTKPTDDVVFDMVSNDVSEVTVEPTTLVFTSSNYNSPQTLTVVTYNDCISDGTQSTSLEIANITTNDTRYQNESLEIPVTIDDSSDNLPNVVFLATHELTTSEIGTNDFFKVYLSCDPGVGNDVVVPIEVSNTAEVSIDKTSLLFTTTDFDQPQIVTITGLSDCNLDADKTVKIRSRDVTSINTDFNRYHDTNPTGGVARKFAFVSVTNQNYGLQSEIVVTVPASGLDMDLNFNTNIHADTFTTVSVRLSCPVVNPVTVGFGFTMEGIVPCSEVKNTAGGNTYLTFDSTNWSVDQSVLMRLYWDLTAGPDFVTLVSGTSYYLDVYESEAVNGDNPAVPIAGSVYSTKTLQFNTTILP
ncbi:MAG: hypothetical protein ABUK01_08650 [Leptospirales bacterium]